MLTMKSRDLISGFLQVLVLIALTGGYFCDDKYGPYNLDFAQFEACTGPKSRNVTDSTLELVKINNRDYIVNLNITFLTNTRINEVKIKVFAMEENKKILLFTNKVNDPCQHYAFATVIKKLFKTSTCAVKKGIYLSTLAMSDIARNFYGQSAFYGQYQTKTIVTTVQENILCWAVTTVFSKHIE